jgi:hypothetical protein
MNTPEFRNTCAAALEGRRGKVPQLSAFLGLDGFVDEIIAVVDERQDARTYCRIPTIARLAERIAAAAGRSTNVELVTTRTKLGGNGPIMANALAAFGVKVTYLGALGYPPSTRCSRNSASHAEVHSIADPGRTDALEFEDGKLLFGKMFPLADVTWDNIEPSTANARWWSSTWPRRRWWVRQLDDAAVHERHLGGDAERDLPEAQRTAALDVLRPRGSGEAADRGAPAGAWN